MCWWIYSYFVVLDRQKSLFYQQSFFEYFSLKLTKMLTLFILTVFLSFKTFFVEIVHLLVYCKTKSRESKSYAHLMAIRSDKWCYDDLLFSNSNFSNCPKRPLVLKQFGMPFFAFSQNRTVLKNSANCRLLHWINETKLSQNPSTFPDALPRNCWPYCPTIYAKL